MRRHCRQALSSIRDFRIDMRGNESAQSEEASESFRESPSQIVPAALPSRGHQICLDRKR